MRHLRSMDMCWTEYLLIGLNLCILQAAFGLTRCKSRSNGSHGIEQLVKKCAWLKEPHKNEYSQNFHPPRAVPLKKGLPIHKWEIHPH